MHVLAYRNIFSFISAPLILLIERKFWETAVGDIYSQVLWWKCSGVALGACSVSGSSPSRAEQFVLPGTRQGRSSRALQAELGRDTKLLGWA